MRILVIGAGAVGTQEPVKLAADPFDGLARPGVALVGQEPHPVHVPDLEGVAEHQQLGLGVHRRPLR